MVPDIDTTPSRPGESSAPVIEGLLGRVEQDARLDRVASTLDDVAGRVATGRRGDWLEGRPMGHTAHPAAVLLPLGCWLSATLLDLSPRRASTTSRRLVGLGVLSGVPAVATGLAEFRTLETPAQRRVAAVHAAGNAMALATFSLSWWRRLRHRQFAGMLAGLVGTALLAVTGYLGGHLAYVTGAGRGRREPRSARALDQATVEAAEPSTSTSTPADT